MEPEVTLTVVRDGMEAEIVLGLLRSAGIACSERQTVDVMGALAPVGPGGAREILVAASDVDAARELLDSRAD